MSLKFRYIPLTFITDEEQIKAQIKNTVILKYFFDLNKSTTKLNKLIEGTQYGYNASALKAGDNKFLRISDITDGKVNWKTVPYCDCSDEETYLLKQEDILIARTGGTTGKSFLILNPPKKSIFAGYLIRIRANKNSNPEFLKLFLNSYVYWSQVTSLNKGDFRPSVNASKLKALLLPKCNEQERLDAIKLSNGESVNGYENLQSEIDKALLDYAQCKEISNVYKEQKNVVINLKQSILQEAFQGNLTKEWRKENLNIEPASLLLKRIKAEKVQLIKDKKIRKEKTLLPISKEEIPFELPKNWVWCRLGELYQTTSGGTPLRSNFEYWNGNIKWYKSGELNDSFLSINSKELISEKGLKESSATLFPSGTLLIAMYGATAGKLAILNNEATTNQAICGFYKNSHLSTLYLFNYLLSNRSKMIKESWGMSQPNISQTYLRNFVFALPPYEEQNAIVEKIENLIQKCNSVKTEIENSEVNTELLLQAVLIEAFDSKEIEETKVVKLPDLQQLEERHFVKRKMLASYIINQSANDEKFGDTKFEKLLHLADYHILKRNLGQEYKQKAAGPYDNKFTVPFFNQTMKAGWFYKQPLGNMNRIFPGRSNNKSQTTYDYFSEEELEKINGLIATFKSFDYKIPEIISTIYAVWNNRIIKKEEISTVLLKQDFLDWDKGKEQYVHPKDRVTPAIKWMKENGFVPNGWGKLIEPPKNKAKRKKRNND
jgi:type I restriction enzyme S subunit